MKKERNFKVKFHNIDLPTTVYLVNAESHYELYERFGGIIMNRGYYHTKATWRAYSSKIPTIAELKKIAFRRLVNKRNIRTYYFYPSSNTSELRFFTSMEKRKKFEVAMEVIRLK